MGRKFIEVSRHEAAPEFPPHDGVSMIPASDRNAHAPDSSVLLVDGNRLAARCSCWWTGTAAYNGRSIAAIGHYAAVDENAGSALLQHACDLLAARGATIAVGPMDGTTWRRYRFIVERGDEPAFFLEPDNPDEWPGHWSRTEFTPLATYTSAVNEDLDRENPRTSDTVSRLSHDRVRIRTIDRAGADDDLRRIFRLSLAAFAENFLYTPIGEEEFVGQYKAVLPYVRPELVLLAEREDQLLGYMFALPDLLQAKRGPVDTVVLKTMAVDPSMRGSGLGSALMDLVQRSARQLGFRRAIHALIHETNISRRISNRYARTIRRYALFSKPLAG